MAGDSIKGLIEQVTADLVTVNGHVDGMEDQIAAAGGQPELVAALQNPPLAELNERKSDLETILADLRKLLADIDIAESNGWPQPQSFTLPASLQRQFEDQNRDLMSAHNLFLPATAVGEDILVDMSAPVDTLPASR